MILDERLELMDATALSTSGTGRAAVGDVIDFGAENRDMGIGEPLFLLIQVTTAVTSGGAATVSFELVSNAASTMGADGSDTVHVVTEAIGKATLVAGYQRAFVIPPVVAAERYVGLLQNVATAALTAGAINAAIVKDVSHIRHLPDAVN